MNIMQVSINYKVDILYGSPTRSNCARIGVSTRNPRYSSEKLRALLDWTTQRYHHVSIDVHDSLQQYNYQTSEALSPTEARKLAIEEGDNWIKLNMPIIIQYPNISIYRHDELAKKVNHLERLEYLIHLYQSDRKFAELIDSESISAKNRKEKRGELGTPRLRESFLHFSRLYILDELALMSLLNETETYVEFYAGRFLNFLKNPDRLKIEGLPSGLKDYPLVEVDFIRAKSRALEFKVA